MELRDCECFVAVAEELHFGRAAVRLGLAQPPLSQRIKALEEELGVRLFERTSRRVVLTPAGEAFWGEAREVLKQAGRARDVARKVGLGQGGRLAVGFVNPAMDAFLAEALARFRTEAPEVVLDLRDLSSREQVEGLAAGRLDLGFVRFVDQRLPGLTVEVVSRERYVVVLPKGHALAGVSRIPLSKLAREPWIFPPRADSPRLHEALAAAFARVGVEPEVVQEARSKFTVMSLVAAGLGVALVPAAARAWRRRGVVFREIDGELPVVELAALRPEGREHTAADRLVALARMGGARRGANTPCGGKTLRQGR